MASHTQDAAGYEQQHIAAQSPMMLPSWGVDGSFLFSPVLRGDPDLSRTGSTGSDNMGLLGPPIQVTSNNSLSDNMPCYSASMLKMVHSGAFAPRRRRRSSRPQSDQEDEESHLDGSFSQTNSRSPSSFQDGAEGNCDDREINKDFEEEEEDDGEKEEEEEEEEDVFGQLLVGNGISRPDHAAVIKSITPSDLGLLEDTPSFKKLLRGKSAQEKLYMEERRSAITDAVMKMNQSTLNRCINRSIIGPDATGIVEIIRKMRRRNKNAGYRKRSCDRKTERHKGDAGRIKDMKKEMAALRAELQEAQRACADKDKKIAEMTTRLQSQRD